MGSTMSRTALLFASALAIAACSRASADSSGPKKSEAPPVKVETVKVSEQPMPHVLTLTGSLVANQQSQLAADATGKVLATRVDRGSLVHQGDILIQLDMRQATISAREQTALADVAKAQSEFAAQECERSKRLLATGAISQAEFDRTSSSCRVGQSSEVAADARLAQAARTLSDSTIRAPFSGLIAERMVSIGEYVQPQTKVALLLEIDPIRVQLTVPESSVSLVKLEQKVDFAVSSYDKESFTGTIKYLTPQLRGSSRDLVVEAIVPNKDGRLRPGMFVTARLDLGESPTVVAPKDALRSDGSITRAFVVTADKTIEERIIQVGETRDDKIAVSDGLKSGETIVLHPSETLADGQRAE
jgi:membrane fusion protein (multidrug efflux system)